MLEMYSQAPKAGNRIRPSGEDRYFHITKVHRNRAYYDWVPDGDSHVFHHKEERYIPIKKLAYDKNLDLWTQTDQFKPDNLEPEMGKRWKAEIDFFGMNHLDTVAKTKKAADRNFAQQLSKRHNKRIQDVLEYFEQYPHRVHIEELKSVT